MGGRSSADRPFTLHQAAMGSDAFSATSKFRVSLVNADGDSERVQVQVGLDGLKVLDPNTGRTMRSYELGHISRWQSRGNSLLLYTRTPVDVEERQLTLQGDEHTIRSALDTLTCSCMQLAELLQSKQTDNDQETANSLHALVAGGGKKKTKLPSADDVEYWKQPDKAGWLQSQGEVMKAWRKRWFVLKQGYLFRFMNSTVTESTKPRGVIDLSKVQDVKPASGVINRPNSIQLKTSSGGSVCYICDSETELVEWMSALDGAIQKIVKHLAGVDDDPPPVPSTARSSHGSAKHSSSQRADTSSSAAASSTSELLRQLERNFGNMAPPSARPSGGGSGASGLSSSSSFRDSGAAGGGSSRRDFDRSASARHYPSTQQYRDYASGSSSRDDRGAAMVDVVGYDTIGGGAPMPSASNYHDSSYAGSSRANGSYSATQRPAGGYATQSSAAYGAGAAALGTLSADTLMNYGGPGGPDISRPAYMPPSPSAANNGAAAATQQWPAAGYGGGYGTAPAAYGASQLQPAHAGSYGGAYGQQAGQFSSPPAAQYGQQPVGYAQGSASSYANQQPAYGMGAAQGGQSGGYQGAPASSLIDAVPQSQPSYPYFQQGGTVPQQQQAVAAPSAQAAGWQVHYTGEGRAYYYNTSTGSTQWEPPPGM